MNPIPTQHPQIPASTVPVGWSRRALLGRALLGVGAVLGAGMGAGMGAAAEAGALPSALPLPSEDAGLVEVHEAEWLDTARQRSVPMRLYWPQQARTQSESAPQTPGLRPLIVFSHGIGGSRRGYSYLGRHWAAQGWASLHVQHVGSDRSLWGGSPWSLLGRLQAAARDDEAIARAQDIRFALDRLSDTPWGSAIDPQRIVAAGHSYGANTTLLVCGAQVQREGGVVALRDPRLKAAIVLSAPPFYGEGDPAAILGSIEVPSLHITATEDVIAIPGYRSGLTDRLAVFEAIGSPHKVLAVFEGGSHSIFTDRAGTGGVALNPQVKAATQALSTAFLHQVFSGNDAALRGWPQRFQPLLSRYEVRPEPVARS